MADKFCLRASRRSIRPDRRNRPVSFPSYRAGKPISDTQLPLRRIKETGIAVIAHSLRRTFVKVGASARWSPAGAAGCDPPPNYGGIGMVPGLGLRGRTLDGPSRAASLRRRVQCAEISSLRRFRRASLRQQKSRSWQFIALGRSQMGLEVGHQRRSERCSSSRCILR